MTYKPPIRIRVPRLEPLEVIHDIHRQELTIAGIRYAYEFFRSIGGIGNNPLRIGEVYKITERKDGVVRLERVTEHDPRWTWYS